MRLFRFFLILLATSGFATAAIEHHVFGVIGGQTLYRGYDLYVSIDSDWIDAFPFTVDTSTNVITAPGHNFTESTNLRWFSTGTLPSPLNPFLSGGFKPTNVSASTLKLQNSWTWQEVDLTTLGIGTHKLGQNFPIGLGQQHLYVKRIDGLPSGVTYNLDLINGQRPAVDPTCAGAGYPCPYLEGDNWQKFRIKFTASRTAALGAAKIVATLKAGTDPDKTLKFRIVIADPVTTHFARPAQFPPIPGKQLWENQMTTLAARNCVDPNITYYINDWATSYAGPAGSWFYDGALTYYLVGDYTHDTQWYRCAENIARQYNDRWLTSYTGLHARFADGLKRYNALETVSKIYHSWYAEGGRPYFGDVSDFAVRETALWLDNALAYRTMSGDKTVEPALRGGADKLLGMLENFSTNRTTINQHIFMDGMAMRALINYWEVTQRKDQRVPGVIKRMIDWIWTNAWDDNTKRMMYNPAPAGPICLGGGCQESDRSLTMMVAPAFAWYWSITGDDTYRVRGDSMFASHIGVLTYDVAVGKPGVFTIPGIGGRLKNGDRVYIHSPCISMGGTPCTSAVPGGLSAHTPYCVEGVSGDTFRLNSLSNCLGSPLEITSQGSGLLNGKFLMLLEGDGTYWNDISYHGKSFGQNYRWAFDYVAWREGKEQNLLYPPSSITTAVQTVTGQ